MNINIFPFFLMVVFSFNLLNQKANAWGGRGHDTICRVAVYLVKEKDLKEYLQNKPQMMGHLCNMPDFYWKSLSGAATKLGNSTHFIDLEITDMKLSEVPEDYQKIVDKYTGTPNRAKEGSTIFSVPTEFGSVWWRADQFIRRIAGLEKEFKTANLPANKADFQNNDLPYNKAVSQMIIDMGLMGHFVGDNSQPFHVTVDYDGWMTGHGGIHAYYEDTAVSFFDGDLDAIVLKKARALKKEKFLTAPTTVQKMKELALVSQKELPQIFKLDPIIKKSEVVREKGMEIKKDAERQPGIVGHKRFAPMIMNQLARSAALLAVMWDEAYVKAGRPTLAAYKSYKYPFTVDFVAPDYFIEPGKAEKK